MEPFVRPLVAILTAALIAPRGSAQQPAIHPDTTIAYVANGKAEQRFDLFLPKARPFATVVFTYGGGWHAPRGPNMGVVCEAFRAKGYACALVAHRISPPDVFPAFAQDEAAAASWVLDHISAFGGDPHRVALVGHSSGAHLAALIATDPQWLQRYHHQPADFAAVIGLSTPVSVMPAPDGRGYGDALLGGKGADAFSRDTNTMRRASPITYAANKSPPMLLVVGEHDFPMLQRDADAFAAAHRRSGSLVEVLVAPGLDHGGTIGAVVEGGNVVVEAVFRFLAAHLR